MMRKPLALLALLLSNAADAGLVGVVVAVPDGDTVAVKIDEQVLNIHLRSIDAPEVGQPYGKRARQSLAELCEAKTATLDDLGIDSARHVFGDVECGGVDAAAEQVKRGMAWTTVRGASPLRDVQAQARAQQRGLWSEPAPVPPWEWSSIFTQQQ